MNGPGPEIQNGRNSPPPGPFGYSFLSPMDTPYEQAPALPPGPSLLDDNESNMLDNFFTTMNANNSFTNDFWVRTQHNKAPGLNFDWSDELPPTFEGSTTSLSQPSYQQHSLGKPSMMAGNTAGTDIYAAASMLYQGDMNGSDIGSALAQQVFGTQPLLNGAHMNGPHPRHNSQSASVAQVNTSSNNRLPTGYHTSEMLFDVRDPIRADQHPSRKVRSLQWGTDISFMDQGYVAPPDQPDEETRTRELLNHLDCFEPQTSAANTRAPSPERMPGGHAHRSSIHSIDTEDVSQPRKRQRIIKEYLSDDDDAKLPPRKSRTPSNTKVRRVSTNAPRKASIQSNSKNARENLSEEQKRTNHILSEQKRRNLIRQGFDDLCSLVPGLRGGGFSKSAMLTQAADWLEDIIRGNDILQSQLADMKNINGLVMPR
ncbi:hypothetical protein N7466_008086 [Penicillium verhagenii]|uniref:uncharacterized protein n=1 Tax=Penicillium verhagenii TaxID=1562060 RepID=UPI002545711A|nr:uncharacterized protein N7466_008086 [Penicillium verhagenii]KAJ5923899.1 hypothetical protein N7466_008086 [Penicillium verhagenii]